MNSKLRNSIDVNYCFIVSNPYYIYILLLLFLTNNAIDSSKKKFLIIHW